MSCVKESRMTWAENTVVWQNYESMYISAEANVIILLIYEADKRYSIH